MTYLLDTNVISKYFRTEQGALRTKVDREVIRGAMTCSVVEAELRFGLYKGGASPRRVQELEAFLDLVEVLPFDSLAAKEYGRLRAHLHKAGAPIGPNDLMIASIALANNLTVVTHNVAEFSRVPDLAVEDWEV